jgi:hypothetical protein
LFAVHGVEAIDLRRVPTANDIPHAPRLHHDVVRWRREIGLSLDAAETGTRFWNRRRWIIIGRSPTDATRLLLSRVIGFRFEAHNLLTFSTTINIRYDQDPRTWSFFLALLASITSIDSTTAQLITDFVVSQRPWPARR